MSSTNPSRFDYPWRAIRELRQDVHELRGQLELALDRIGALAAEHEADVKREEWELRETAEHDGDLAYEPPDDPKPDDPPEPLWDPGPEVDDQGGMSETDPMADQV